MTLYGFALLPDTGTQQKLIDFQQKHREFIGGAALGLDKNLPHVSLLQCPFDSEFDYLPIMKRIISNSLLVGSAFYSSVQEFIHENFTASFTELYRYPKNWLFAGVEQEADTALSAHMGLQEILLNATKEHILYEQIDKKRDISKYTDAERKSFLKYGYKYIGDAFRPHITLGLVDDQSAPTPAIKDNFNEMFVGKRFAFDSLVFYKAGETGACAEVIHSTSIPDK
jgi:2'-5' RNA ligase